MLVISSSMKHTYLYERTVYICMLASFTLQPECSRSNSKEVCGVNGETFPTECHSDNEYVAVDYHGHCKSIPGTGNLYIQCQQL